MVDSESFERLFRLIPDPALIVREDGRVERANLAAQMLLGSDPSGTDLMAFAGLDRDALRAYLGRCAGTTRPLPGAFAIEGACGEIKSWQSHGARFTPAADGGTRILLTYRRNAVQDFSVLGQKVRELNDEIRYRRRVQAELEAAVAEKDTLLHELQHRLKNHTQMLLAMVRAARRDARSPELQQFADSILQRLHAIGTAQSFMYGMTQWKLVSAGHFIRALCRALAGSWPAEARLNVVVDEVDLDNNHAVPLALIINELTTNALKHGLSFGSGWVEVAFRRADEELTLTVRDSGTVWNGSSGGSAESGLQLVKGLCRQIGASFEIETDSGTCCIVRWSAKRKETA